MGRKEGASRTCFPFLRFFRAASWRLFSNSGSVSALSCSGSWGGGTQRAAKERNGRKGRRSSKASQQRVRGLRAQGTCVARAHAVLPRLGFPTPWCVCAARMRAQGGRVSRGKGDGDRVGCGFWRVVAIETKRTWDTPRRSDDCLRFLSPPSLGGVRSRAC